MFPNRSEWKAWNALEKASYIAQLAAALSLLPTVVFAWLGWRESRLSRYEQVRFFEAQNAPEVELSEVKLVNESDKGGVLTFVLRNTGGTSASNVRLQLILAGDQKALRDTGEPDDIFRNLSVPKGGEVILPTIGVEDIERRLGWRPTGVDFYIFGKKDPPPSRQSAVAIVEVSFESPFGKDYSRLRTIVLSR